MAKKVQVERDPSIQPKVSVDELKERIQRLEQEKETLRLKLWKCERRPSTLTDYILLAVGAAALTSATIYSSSILAFIGLGLTFWGVLFDRSNILGVNKTKAKAYSPTGIGIRINREILGFE